MREQNEVTAELVATLRRLVDVLEEIVQSSQGEEQPTVSESEEAARRYAWCLRGFPSKGTVPQSSL